MRGQKKTIEIIRDTLTPGSVFYYADELNLSWLPTLQPLWSPKSQKAMIRTPGQTKKRYGIGAVNYHTGTTVVIVRRRKRRLEIAELLSSFWTNIRMKPSMSPGTMPQPTQTMKSKRSSVAPLVGSFYSALWAFRPTAYGSIPLRCSGVTFAAKSYTVNCSSISKRSSMQRSHALIATTRCHIAYCRSSAPIPITFLNGLSALVPHILLLSVHNPPIDSG